MKAKLAALGVVMLLLSGCRVTRGEVYRVDPAFLDSRILEAGKETTLKLAEFKFPGDADLAYTEATAPDDSGKVARNRLVATLMTAADTQCEIHKSSALATSTNFNLGLNVLSSALAGAAPLLSHIATKDALAAGAAFASSTRSQFNDEVYRQMFVTTILQAIDNNREQKAAAIITRRALSTVDYSIDDAVRDVVDYHESCSFYDGLVELADSVKKKSGCSGLMLRRAALLQEVGNAALAAAAKTSLENELTAIDQKLADCD